MALEREFDVGALIEGTGLGRLQISIVALLSAVMVLEGFDMQVMSFAAPAVMNLWHVSKASFGLVLSASMVGYMAGALTLSLAGDRLGRKNIIIAGVAIFGLFTAAAVLAETLPVLLALRLLAGLGLGGAIPAGIALTVEYMPARVRATTIGIMFVGYNVGAAGGGFISAATIPLYGWHSVFYIGGLAALPVVLALMLALPESVRFLAVKARHPERIAAIVRRLRPDLDLAGVTRFTLAEEAGRASPAALFGGGRAAMTILLWFAFIASFTGHYFLTGWLPTVLSDDGLSLAQANLATGTFQAGGALGSLLAGYLLDRWGVGMVAACFFVAAPFVVSLGVIGGYGPLLLAVIFLAGVSVLGGQIGLNAMAGTFYPTAMRTTGAGWGLGIGRIGSISGPIIGGYLITAGFSRPTLFALAALPLCAAAVALVALSAQTPRRRAAREFAH